MDTTTIANKLRHSGLEAWVLCDFRGSNPVLRNLLRLNKHAHLTRRAVAIFTPGGADLLVHEIDAPSVGVVSNISQATYRTWQEYEGWMRAHVPDSGQVAMEYSPLGKIPAVSWADAGTVEFVRSLGAEVISSAELYQGVAAAWSPEGEKLHREAARHLIDIKDLAFAEIGDSTRTGHPITEFAVQSLMAEEFRSRGLVTDELPLVAVNANSGNAHYWPTESSSSVIEQGDWVMLDLWAKVDAPDAIFADITWTGYVGDQVPLHHHEIFDFVLGARDAALDYLCTHWRVEAPIEAWVLDRVARDYIAEAGFGDYFVHRTGHSLSAGENPHGLGANLDDYETHDTRTLSEGLGFTIEPGIYLPDFGVRSEINVLISSTGPVVTTDIQRTPVLMR